MVYALISIYPQVRCSNRWLPDLHSRRSEIPSIRLHPRYQPWRSVFANFDKDAGKEIYGLAMNDIHLLNIVSLSQRAIQKQIVGALIPVAAFLLFWGCVDDPETTKVDFSRRVAIQQPGEEKAETNVLKVAVGAMISPRETANQYYALLGYIADKTGKKVELIQRRTYSQTQRTPGQRPGRRGFHMFRALRDRKRYIQFSSPGRAVGAQQTHLPVLPDRSRGQCLSKFIGSAG